MPTIPLDDDGTHQFEVTIGGQPHNFCLDVLEANDVFAEIGAQSRDDLPAYIPRLKAWFAAQDGVPPLSVLTMTRVRDAVFQRMDALLGKGPAPGTSAGAA